MIDTKQKILDTAQRLIGEQGYSGTSLRHIIAEAGVNLAAVHYHFGSKEELLDELVARKAGPVNEERLRRLDRLTNRTPAAKCHPGARGLFSADGRSRRPRPCLRPPHGACHRGGTHGRDCTAALSNCESKFLAALRQALPNLSEDEFLWRAHFMLGAMAHTMCGQPDTTGKGGSAGSFSERIERLIAFLDGGFQAPVRLAAGVQEKGK